MVPDLISHTRSKNILTLTAFIPTTKNVNFVTPHSLPATNTVYLVITSQNPHTSDCRPTLHKLSKALEAASELQAPTELQDANHVLGIHTQAPPKTSFVATVTRRPGFVHPCGTPSCKYLYLCESSSARPTLQRNVQKSTGRGNIGELSSCWNCCSISRY